MRNARGQQGEASKVKISSSEEKAHRKQATKSLVSIYDIFFPIKCVTRKFHLVVACKTTSKKCAKTCGARSKFLLVAN